MQSDSHAASKRSGCGVAGQVLQSAISSCAVNTTNIPQGDNLRCQERVERVLAVSSFVAKLILQAPRLSQSYHPSSPAAGPCAQLNGTKRERELEGQHHHPAYLAFKILKWAWRQLNDNRSSSEPASASASAIAIPIRIRISCVIVSSI